MPDIGETKLSDRFFDKTKAEASTNEPKLNPQESRQDQFSGMLSIMFSGLYKWIQGGGFFGIAGLVASVFGEGKAALTTTETIKEKKSESDGDAPILKRKVEINNDTASVVSESGSVS